MEVTHRHGREKKEGKRTLEESFVCIPSGGTLKKKKTCSLALIPQTKKRTTNQVDIQKKKNNNSPFPYPLCLLTWYLDLDHSFNKRPALWSVAHLNRKHFVQRAEMLSTSGFYSFVTLNPDFVFQTSVSDGTILNSDSPCKQLRSQRNAANVLLLYTLHTKNKTPACQVLSVKNGTIISQRDKKVKSKARF